jgi:hypothetical protein
MAYTINKTDGSVLTTVADGQIDQLSTDLTLIGRNYSGFGEFLNENLIKMLENFASVTQPQNPLKGEIWFDTAESRLKVYNGVDFATVGSATISALQPTTLNPGDLWFNETDRQLYFYDGSSTILLGPLYSKLQGLSGFRIDNVIDTQNQTRVVASMYVGGTLVGIFSKDSFTPKNEITGFTGSILPGFNGANISNLRLNARATDSDKLDGKSADLYVTKDSNPIINGSVSLSTDLGLNIGATPGNGQFIINDGDVVIANTAANRDIRLVVRRINTLETAVSVETLTQTVNFYDGQPDSIVRAGGNMIVEGDLTVNGTTTSVNSSVLLIEDKNIELAKTTTPTDANADGGGLILKGTTDHTLLWSDSRDAWESSEHINLVSGKSYKINNIVVIDENGLGPGITSAPGITSFGVQSELTVDDLFLNDNIIESTPINSSIILKPNGTGSVNISAKRITNLADPSANQDASTKNYTDFTIRGMSLIFSIDTTGLTNADIANYLTILAPPVQYRNGTEARLLCVQYTNNSVPLNINSLVQTSTVQVSTTSPVGSANVLTNITFTDTELGIPGGQITIPAQDITISRFIKIFRIQAGVWTNIS